MNSNKLVLFPFIGNSIGGSHHSALLLIQKLESTSFKPMVCVFQNGPLATYLEKLQIPYEVLPSNLMVNQGNISKELSQLAYNSLALSRILKKYRISIVHTNDLTMHQTWGPAAKLANCKFIWHQRTKNPSRRLDLYSSFADKIITISNYCKSNLPKKMSNRCKIVYDPVEISNYDNSKNHQAEFLKEVGASSDCKVIGFFANTTQQKRPFIFLETAYQIRKKYTKPILFPMFGSIPPDMLTAIKTKIEELNLSDSCLLMGTKHPIEPYISACDIVLAPAVEEGWGRVLVEAIQLGVPVIAANDGGHKEIIKNADMGYLMPCDNSNAFAEKALELLNAPKIPKKMMNTEMNSSASHLKEMTDIYQSLYGHANE